MRLAQTDWLACPNKGHIVAKFGFETLIRPALLSAALISLGGCVYGPGGYYDDGYVNGYDGGYSSGYVCDPYDPFDSYYNCDYGYGFANIGFGGGWYDNFYYPGYGLYLFDRAGHRHAMKNHHRRHWAQRRAEHGTRHVRHDNGKKDNRRYERRGHRDVTPKQRAERRKRRQDSRGSRKTQSTTVRHVDPVASIRRNNQKKPVRADGSPRITRPAFATEQAQRRRPVATNRPVRPQNRAQPPRVAPPRATRPVVHVPRPTPRTSPKKKVQRQID